MLIQKRAKVVGSTINVFIEQVKEVNMGSVKKPTDVISFEYVPDSRVIK